MRNSKSKPFQRGFLFSLPKFPRKERRKCQILHFEFIKFVTQMKTALKWKRHKLLQGTLNFMVVKAMMDSF